MPVNWFSRGRGSGRGPTPASSRPQDLNRDMARLSIHRSGRIVINVAAGEAFNLKRFRKVLRGLDAEGCENGCKKLVLKFLAENNPHAVSIHWQSGLAKIYGKELLLTLGIYGDTVFGLPVTWDEDTQTMTAEVPVSSEAQ